MTFEERPVVELGVATLGLAVGVSAVLWWCGYLLVRWIVEQL